MRGLVVLVSVMSLLIVVCMGFVIYGLTTKLGSEKMADIPALVLPEGSKVTDMTDYKGNLALTVVQGKTQSIYVVNPKTGKAVLRMPIETGVIPQQP